MGASLARKEARKRKFGTLKNDEDQAGVSLSKDEIPDVEEAGAEVRQGPEIETQDRDRKFKKQKFILFVGSIERSVQFHHIC